MASWFPPPSLFPVMLDFLRPCSASHPTSKATHLRGEVRAFLPKGIMKTSSRLVIPLEINRRMG